jgi:hypothetical protein
VRALAVALVLVAVPASASAEDPYEAFAFEDADALRSPWLDLAAMWCSRRPEPLISPRSFTDRLMRDVEQLSTLGHRARARSASRRREAPVQTRRPQVRVVVGAWSWP